MLYGKHLTAERLGPTPPTNSWGNPCYCQSTNGIHTKQNDAGERSLSTFRYNVRKENTRTKPAGYVENLEEALSVCHQAASDNLGEAQLRQKRTYDIKSNTRSYEVGDVVYMVDTSSKVGQSKKLRKPWIGPFVIVYKFNHVLYRIQGKKGKQVGPP